MDEADGRGRKRNWGRWGAEDERGAANLLTPDWVRQAAERIRSGRVFSLAADIRDGRGPASPGRHAPQHFMRTDGGDYAAGLKRHSGFQSADDVIVLPTHGTTHIDALAHIADEDTLYNGFPLSTVRSRGAARLGIEKAPPLVGPGVLLDVFSLKGNDVPHGTVITPEDLEACEKAQGCKVEPGTIVLIRTGWMAAFKARPDDPPPDKEAGIGLEAAHWLADRDAVAVGADNYGVEVVPTETGITAPVHRLLIRNAGIYLMELLDLEELAGDNAYEFLFVAAPLRIVGGTGSPLTPLAVT